MFDGVALDYKSITVIADATAAATAEVQAGMCYLYFLSVTFVPYL